MRDYKLVRVGATCYDIVANGSQSENDAFNCTFVGQYHKEDGTTASLTVPMASGDVLRMLGDYWGTYSLLVNKDFAGTSTDRALLASSFSTWYSQNSENVSRIFDAYFSEYNPIENYHGIEVTTDEYGSSLDPFKRTKSISGKVKTGTNVDSYSEAGQVTAGATIDADSYGNLTTSHSETTFDDSTPKLVSQEDVPLSGGHSKTKGSAADNYTEWDEYKEESTEEGTKTSRLDKKGNLGVTTSQHMIEEELNLRKHYLFREFLSRYVHDCLSLIDPDAYYGVEGL